MGEGKRVVVKGDGVGMGSERKWLSKGGVGKWGDGKKERDGDKLEKKINLN